MATNDPVGDQLCPKFDTSCNDGKQHDRLEKKFGVTNYSASSGEQNPRWNLYETDNDRKEENISTVKASSPLRDQIEQQNTTNADNLSGACSNLNCSFSAESVTVNACKHNEDSRRSLTTGDTARHALERMEVSNFASEYVQFISLCLSLNITH